MEIGPHLRVRPNYQVNGQTQTSFRNTAIDSQAHCWEFCTGGFSIPTINKSWDPDMAPHCWRKHFTKQAAMYKTRIQWWCCLAQTKFGALHAHPLVNNRISQNINSIPSTSKGKVAILLQTTIILRELNPNRSLESIKTYQIISKFEI